MTRIDPSGPDSPEGGSAKFVLIGAVVVFAAYATVLAVARGGGPVEILAGALANTVPVVLLGLVARGVILRRLIGRSALVTGLGHAGLALAFSALSYWSLLVLLGVINGVSATEFDVRPFDQRAMAWQSLQNLTTYGLIAALTHLQATSPASPVEASAPKTAPEGQSRYFIRSGEDFRPMDTARIVSIAGADDYAEVRTLEGRHLVRMTLGEFEASLDAERFARVHRSHIVNLERIDRAEPAGNGRLLLHMETGERIQTSRAGARRVKDRVI